MNNINRIDPVKTVNPVSPWFQDPRLHIWATKSIVRHYCRPKLLMVAIIRLNQK